MTLYLCHYLKKEPFWIKKLKKNAERRLRQLPLTIWFKQGQTEQWWENLLSGVVPEEDWKNNLKMSQETINPSRPVHFRKWY